MAVSLWPGGGSQGPLPGLSRSERSAGWPQHEHAVSGYPQEPAGHDGSSFGREYLNRIAHLRSGRWGGPGHDRLRLENGWPVDGAVVGDRPRQQVVGVRPGDAGPELRGPIAGQMPGRIAGEQLERVGAVRV